MRGVLTAPPTWHANLGMYSAFPVNDKHNFARCVVNVDHDFMDQGASQLTAGDVAEVMRQQTTGSNIHCGTSSKPAVSNGSRAQRSTDSPFFLCLVVKIHTVCPYHGCQR